jgi:hypothetical protein
MAVFELLEDLRDRVWAHYEFALVTQFAEDRVYRCDVVDSDPPF